MSDGILTSSFDAILHGVKVEVGVGFPSVGILLEVVSDILSKNVRMSGIRIRVHKAIYGIIFRILPKAIMTTSYSCFPKAGDDVDDGNINISDVDMDSS